MGVQIIFHDAFEQSINLPLSNHSVAEVFQLSQDYLTVQGHVARGFSDLSERAAAATCVAFHLRDQLRWQAFGVLYRSHGLGELESQHFKGLLYAMSTKDRLSVSPVFLRYHGLEIRGHDIHVLYRG